MPMSGSIDSSNVPLIGLIGPDSSGHMNSPIWVRHRLKYLDESGLYAGGGKKLHQASYQVAHYFFELLLITNLDKLMLNILVFNPSGYNRTDIGSTNVPTITSANSNLSHLNTLDKTQLSCHVTCLNKRCHWKSPVYLLKKKATN